VLTSLEQTFKLQVPSSPENLAMVRDFVTAVGAQAGLSNGDVAKLEMAVDEACANVIEHAYGNDVAQELTVRATFDEAELRVAVVDTGRGFDPQAQPDGDVKKLIAERKSGGLGLRIIRSLMDQVRYEIEPGKKNELQMVMHLRKA
jgi:anti-sigma regulatory factor (Ser/Thr protein kinase)